MTTDQLLDQLQCLISSYSPVVEKGKLPQSSTGHRSTRVNDALPSEGVPPLPQRNPLSDDKGIADRTFQNPQLFNQDEKPSSGAKGIRARCQTWLQVRLNDGPVPLSEVKQEAQQLGYSSKALRVAREQLGVKPVPCLALPAEKHS